MSDTGTGRPASVLRAPLEPAPTVPLGATEPTRATVPLTPLQPTQATVPLTPLQPTQAVPLGQLEPTRTTGRMMARTVASPAATRVVTAVPEPTFDSAVSVIVGTDLDLRGASAPKGGWLTLGSGQDIQFSAYGTTLFAVGQDAAAADAWQRAAWTFEDIDHELFTGRYGLVDVPRLRAAADAVDSRIGMLTTAIDDMARWARPDVGGAGDAAAALAGRLGEMVESLTAVRDQLATPAPAVSAPLRDAAEALSEFARQLSYVWWESNTVLLGTPDDAVRAISANIEQYLAASGVLGGEGPPPADPAAALEQIRAVLARYDSAAGGGLLPGMDPIAGDLTRQPVWDAANAAITRRLATELDKLDAVARTQVEKLAGTLDTVTRRLSSTPRLLSRLHAGLPPTGRPTSQAVLVQDDPPGTRPDQDRPAG